jgi:hypothetical protein
MSLIETGSGTLNIRSVSKTISFESKTLISYQHLLVHVFLSYKPGPVFYFGLFRPVAGTGTGTSLRCPGLTCPKLKKLR